MAAQHRSVAARHTARRLGQAHTVRGRAGFSREGERVGWPAIARTQRERRLNGSAGAWMIGFAGIEIDRSRKSGRSRDSGSSRQRYVGRTRHTRGRSSSSNWVRNVRGTEAGRRRCSLSAQGMTCEGSSVERSPFTNAERVGRRRAPFSRWRGLQSRYGALAARSDLLVVRGS